MKMTNLDVRLLVADRGVRYGDIANYIGMSSIYLSRLMARPLNPDKKRIIFKAIEEITGEPVNFE